MQNSFANSSFGRRVGRVQGTILDYPMPPLATGDLLTALAAAAVTRAILVGVTVWLAMLLWPDVHVGVRHFWALIWFGLMGAVLLTLLGLLTSVWAEKFDHAAAVTNFVIAPLSLLSGTFYSIDNLHGTFRLISNLNPLFYDISGFRYALDRKSKRRNS